jgi:hypothetical protein
MDDRPRDDGDLQRQIDDLSNRVDTNRADIDALATRSDVADDRADDMDARSDAADHRADDMDARSDAADDRMNRMQAASNLDREMIVELQAAGVVSQQHAAQMEEALRSSRTIGSAIGIIMASRQVSDDAAFAILKGASQNSNRKLRDLAEDLVRETADVGDGDGGGLGTR